MAEIRNDEGFVSSTTLVGFRKLTGWELNAVAEVSAIGVGAEADCTCTYENGQQTTKAIATFLEKAYQCMNETSCFLQATDEQSARSTTSASSWSVKLKLK